MRATFHGKMPFTVSLPNSDASASPVTRLCRYKEISLVLMLQFLGQGVTLAFAPDYLRTTLHKAVATIDGKSSGRDKHSQRKTFVK